MLKYLIYIYMLTQHTIITNHQIFQCFHRHIPPVRRYNLYRHHQAHTCRQTSQTIFETTTSICATLIIRWFVSLLSRFRLAPGRFAVIWKNLVSNILLKKRYERKRERKCLTWALRISRANAFLFDVRWGFYYTL